MIAPPLGAEWVLPAPGRRPAAEALARALDVPVAMAWALVNRGLDDPAHARRFLEPGAGDLHDPFGLLDLDRAVERLRRAVADDEPVLVHGDYDVDGITSTFLLYRTLIAMGGRAWYRIPHRVRDGYGLSVDAVEEAHRRGCGVIVTVDCGITAHEPVARARALGIDTVITDHHEPQETLPDAAAVVDPLRPGCRYPFKQLAGVGVTWKLVNALLDGSSRSDAAEFLDLVAIGTIADVVPLVGENRVLAHLGLDRLNRTARPGLKALIEVSGIAERKVTSGQVAFVLAPRINAAGRMGNPEQGMHLLLARDDGEARAVAESLEEDNDRRRRHDEEVLAEASRMVEEESGWPRCASILLWSERWHPGVIGIVASRLVERYQRPAVLVALDGARGRGSGRSVRGLDLSRVLGACGDLLESYGGHMFAAGLSVTRERLPELRARFETLVAERLAPEDCVRRLMIDAELGIGACSFELAEGLERLAPHGLGNAEPLYVARDVSVRGVTRVGRGRHLRMSVRDPSGGATAIGFGLGDEAERLGQAGRCDLAFVPMRNEWMGVPRLQLKVKGVRIP